MIMACREGRVDDLAAVHRMIVALAVFEREPPEAVKTTVASMVRDWQAGVFGFFVAELDGLVVGFALWHWRYSTWTGRCLFLEDLYVEESARSRGCGRALFMCCVRLAAAEDVARLQWQVLGWNESAKRFYGAFDAEITADWLNCKLVREQLHRLAAAE